MRHLVCSLLLLVLAGLLQAAPAAGAAPPAEPTAPITFREGRFSEFLVEPGGRVWLFPEAADVALPIWQDGAWSEGSRQSLPGTVRQIVRAGERQWLLLCQGGGDDVRLCTYDGDRLAQTAMVPGQFEHPTLHLSPDGVAWVLSGEGTAYGVRDKQRFTHPFGPAVDKKSGCYRYYPPTLGVDVPGSGTWFWSHVQHEALNLAGGQDRGIVGFQVFRDDQWASVPPPVVTGERLQAEIAIDNWFRFAAADEPDGVHSDPIDEVKQVPPERLKGRLGGVALMLDGRLACGWRYGHYCAISPQDGVVQPLPIEAPPGEHCLFLHTAPDGRLLTVTAPPSMFMRLPPVKGGWTGTLLAYDGSRTHELLNGVDFGKGSFDSGRPVADTPAGTFLAATGAGLVFVPQGEPKAYRLDWRHGVPLRDVTRLRVDERRLYLLDRERGFAVLDWRELSRQAVQPRESREWSVDAAAGDAYLAMDGTIWLVTAEVPGRVRHFDGQAWSETSLEGSAFPVQSLWYLTSDTRGRLWLISNFETHETVILENGRWRSFVLRETAYSTIALEEKGNRDFRVGTPRDHCYPAFAGDGRVAYQNEWSRICFFDGTATWNDGYGEGHIDGRSPEGPPFYVDGVLTAKAGDAFYQWRESAWVPLRQDLASPYGDRPRDPPRVDLPRSFPGDPQSSPVRLKDNTGTVWAGTMDRLWRGLGDTWVEFGTRGTPIPMGRQISSVAVDRTGGMWFSLSGSDYTRVVHYQPSDPPGALAWAEEPPASTATDAITLKVRSGGVSAPIRWAWCLDEGDWQFAKPDPGGGDYMLTLRDLQNGPHVCRIRAHDGLLRGTPELTHRFEVRRDVEREISTCIGRLQSASNAEREDAARVLRGLGAAALPALRRSLDQAEPEVRWWFRAVIEEIERQGAK